MIGRGEAGAWDSHDVLNPAVVRRDGTYFNFYSGFGLPRPKPTTQFPPPFKHGTPDGYKFFLEMGPLANERRPQAIGKMIEDAKAKGARVLAGDPPADRPARSRNGEREPRD